MAPMAHANVVDNHHPCRFEFGTLTSRTLLRFQLSSYSKLAVDVCLTGMFQFN